MGKGLNSTVINYTNSKKLLQEQDREIKRLNEIIENQGEAK